MKNAKGKLNKTANIGFTQSMDVEFYSGKTGNLIASESVEFQELEISVSSGTNQEFLTVKPHTGLTVGDIVKVILPEQDIFFIIDKKEDNHTFYIQYSVTWLLDFYEAANVNPNSSQFLHYKKLTPDFLSIKEILEKSVSSKNLDATNNFLVARDYPVGHQFVNDDSSNYPFKFSIENGDNLSEYSNSAPTLSGSPQRGDTAYSKTKSSGLLSLHNILKSFLRTCASYDFNIDCSSNETDGNTVFDLKTSNSSYHNIDLNSTDILSYELPEIERKYTSLNYEESINVEFEGIDDSDKNTILSTMIPFTPVSMTFHKKKDGSIFTEDSWENYTSQERKDNCIYPAKHGRIQNILNYKVTKKEDDDGGN